MQQFDALIVGTGQAAPALADRLSRSGMKVAIFERHLFGGTCVNTGCIPTKAMVASAYAAQMARRAQDYGLRVESLRVDMAAVRERKARISAKSRQGVEQWLRSMPNVTVVQGHARFVDAQTLSVSNERYSAPRIFLDVGGRPTQPPIAGLERTPYLSNRTIMDLDTVPEHLIVIGGSYIGLEFGQMFRRFGARVTIVEKGPRLIAREDADISAEVQSILSAEGIDVRVGADCIAVEPTAARVSVRARCADGEQRIEGTHLLVAVGRRPNTDDLDVAAAGIKLDERGYIEVDDELQSNVPGIWALGDCNGRGAFTHTAYNDFEIVAANLLDADRRRVSDRIAAYALYIDPPLGRAGMTEAEALRSGRNVLKGTLPMTRVGRAVERGETLGFMKVLVDADSRQILGAALLGAGGDEVIHTLLDVMYAKAPYTTITRAMHIHPTVAEFLPVLLGNLQPLAAADPHP